MFLIHALDGILPSGYALKENDGIDEELRLLYVAVTRAEDNLFISYPVLQYRRHQGEFLSNPSPEKVIHTNVSIGMHLSS